jgi:hypothetical protein
MVVRGTVTVTTSRTAWAGCGPRVEKPKMSDAAATTAIGAVSTGRRNVLIASMPARYAIHADDAVVGLDSPS